MCCWVKAILWTCCMLYLPLSSIPFLPLLSNNGEKSQMLRVFSLSFSLSLSLYVSHSTLLPLYLSTPECNQFSVGVVELMRGRRVQGLNEYGDHTWAAAHLIAVFSPQAGLVLTLHACLGAGVFFFFLVYWVSLGRRLLVVQLFFSFCFRVSFRSLGGDAGSDGLLRGRPRVFPTFVPFGWDSQPPFDCPWFSFGNKLNTFLIKLVG